MNEYYTYAYLREDGTPYYIGKGKGKRIDFPHKRKIKIPPKERRIFLKQNLTEEEAFKHEKYMITVFGRKDLGTGILRNLTNGGDGVSGISEETKEKIRTKLLGVPLSEDRKKKISNSKKGKTSWNKGISPSEETLEKMKKSKIGHKSGMVGKIHTEETKKKMRESKIGKSMSEKVKKKMKEDRVGEGNNFYGKNHSEESRKKMSESQKLAWEKRKYKKELEKEFMNRES